MKFLIGFLVVLTAVGCNKSNVDKVKVSSASGPLPIERGTNISIIYTDSGFKKARVFAPLLERYSTEDRTDAEMKQGITAYFYEPNGKISSYLKSKYAKRDEKNFTMLVRDDVNVVNNKGDTLKTEELNWDEKTNRIYTDKYVQIHSVDRIIYGTGLESNAEFTRYRIFNIKGIVNLKN